MEYLLKQELLALGLVVDKVSPRGAYVSADLSQIYKICLWSRVAARVRLILGAAEVATAQDILHLCLNIDWQHVFTADKSIAVSFYGTNTLITNTMYGAQLVKDGVVDYFKQFATRPNVDKHNPDISIHAAWQRDMLTISLDLTGYSLHQRGYRQQTGDAPIKENIAAAILLRAGWLELASKGYALCDPFCGSGTFLIEGYLMAANIAPGLFRSDQAFVNWLGHDRHVWTDAVQTAIAQQKNIANKFYGFDTDPKVIAIAKHNLINAEIDSITIKQQAIKDFAALPERSLIVSNPPYGERLADIEHLIPLYQDFGRALSLCKDSRAAILTSNAELAKKIGLRVDKKYTFYNGALEVVLYCINIAEDNEFRTKAVFNLSENASALKNRLLKNKKHLAKWLKRTGVSCYRLYDADIPEYACAIDIYNDWAHVQEYKAPQDIPESKTKRRMEEVKYILQNVLEFPIDHVVLKQRLQQKGKQQYQAFDSNSKAITVLEGNAKFKVDLHSYLDTGLFLDHRSLRLSLAAKFSGKKFLNCFCYTAAFSVHAALAGAKTYNIDMSKTYLNWALDNFKLNKINADRHEFIQANCLEWLRNASGKFDIILLDPPSFSNSKRMEETFDVQRDQEQLIDSAMRLLTNNGELYFSNNLRKFKLAESIKEKYLVTDITAQTIDEDFRRAKFAHHCYVIKLRPMV